MLELSILFPSFLNGITTGAIYALIALGLTLIYGVLHIINFAHGAALMMALYGVFFLHQRAGLDPYLSLPVMVPAMFAAGYALYRFVVAKASHGKDENILLVTLGGQFALGFGGMKPQRQADQCKYQNSSFSHKASLFSIFRVFPRSDATFDPFCQR